MNPFNAPPALRRWLLIAPLLLTMLLLHPPVLGAIYKWTDSSGEVHYTQTPPPEGIAAQEIEGAPPPAESQQTIHEEQLRLQERLEAFDERRAELPDRALGAARPPAAEIRQQVPRRGEKDACGERDHDGSSLARQDH